jgi:acetyl esterase/lipase
MQKISRRSAIQLVAGGCAVASFGSLIPQSARAATDTAFDITPYVDPELRRALPQLMLRAAAVPTDANLQIFRQGAASYAQPPLPAPAWSEKRIPGPPDAPEVTIYIVNGSSSGAPRPIILYIHGGGYTVGTARSSLRSVQELAQAVGCIVISVDYRLAPETRFPGALEDNYAALKWAHGHAEEFGGDPTRIAVMGESAGGGHAAMLTIAARDRSEVPIIYQALIYPMLDDRTGSTRQVPPYQGAVGWTAAHNRYGWSALLGVPAGSSSVPAGAVPARVTDLRGLPPAFIGVGTIDLFVDEDIEYARRLIDHGIAAQLEAVPGAFHGFDKIPATTIGPRFRETVYAALKNAFSSAR